MGNFQTFNKNFNCIRLLLLLENVLKLNLEALQQTENLNPLQGPTHILTHHQYTQRTGRNTTYGFIMAYAILPFVSVCSAETNRASCFWVEPCEMVTQG